MTIPDSNVRIVTKRMRLQGALKRGWFVVTRALNLDPHTRWSKAIIFLVPFLFLPSWYGLTNSWIHLFQNRLSTAEGKEGVWSRALPPSGLNVCRASPWHVT